MALPELTLPRYSFVEGDVVKVWEKPDGSLTSSVWRNGAWVKGGDLVGSEYRGSALSPTQVAEMLGEEAIKS
jgi:hypothetical protein